MIVSAIFVSLIQGIELCGAEGWGWHDLGGPDHCQNVCDTLTLLCSGASVNPRDRRVVSVVSMSACDKSLHTATVEKRGIRQVV